MILAGDIGGTNTRLGFFELEGDRLKAAAMDVYPSREYESLDEIVVKFVAKHDQRVERACFGVAGPVISGRSRLSNLDWDVDADRLAQRLGLNTVVAIGPSLRGRACRLCASQQNRGRLAVLSYEGVSARQL